MKKGPPTVDLFLMNSHRWHMRYTNTFVKVTQTVWYKRDSEISVIPVFHAKLARVHMKWLPSFEDYVPLNGFVHDFCHCGSNDMITGGKATLDGPHGTIVGPADRDLDLGIIGASPEEFHQSRVDEREVVGAGFLEGFPIRRRGQDTTVFLDEVGLFDEPFIVDDFVIEFPDGSRETNDDLAFSVGVGSFDDDIAIGVGNVGHMLLADFISRCEPGLNCLHLERFGVRVDVFLDAGIFSRDDGFSHGVTPSWLLDGIVRVKNTDKIIYI